MIFETRTREYQLFLFRCAQTVQQEGERLVVELAKINPEYHVLQRAVAAVSHDLAVLERALARFQQQASDP